MRTVDDILRVRLKSAFQETEKLKVLEFEALPRQPLPPFTAGAHIDVHPPNGMIRSYSLINPPSDGDRYRIAVQREAEGRGGSVFVHDKLQVGDEITISKPRNNFALDDLASHSVLIGGGVGVTPLVCMALHLQEAGRGWELHYAARSKFDIAFRDLLEPLSAKVRFYCSRDAVERSRLDLSALLANIPPQAHIYCCGPNRMLEELCGLAKDKPAHLFHTERFSSGEAIATDGSFEVVLARSGRTLLIPAGKTIVDVLLEQSIDAKYSCLEGVCSTCETRVISGMPDHRDVVLSDEERAANDRMMICCSRSKTPSLVLDL